MKKYFKSRKEAMAAKAERNASGSSVSVYRMPKGSRHAGEYAVCSYVEYLNTY